MSEMAGTWGYLLETRQVDEMPDGYAGVAVGGFPTREAALAYGVEHEFIDAPSSEEETVACFNERVVNIILPENLGSVGYDEVSMETLVGIARDAYDRASTRERERS